MDVAAFIGEERRALLLRHCERVGLRVRYVGFDGAGDAHEGDCHEGREQQGHDDRQVHRARRHHAERVARDDGRQDRPARPMLPIIAPYPLARASTQYITQHKVRCRWSFSVPGDVGARADLSNVRCEGDRRDVRTARTSSAEHGQARYVRSACSRSAVPSHTRRRPMSEDTENSTVSRAQRMFGTLAPKLASLTDDVLFGDVWKRPALSPRDRSLITVAALVALCRENQLPGHFSRALGNGVQQEELVEIITHLAIYAGWPNAVTAIATLGAVLEQENDGAIPTS